MSAQKKITINLPSGNQWVLDPWVSFGKLQNVNEETTPHQLMIVFTDSWSYPYPVSVDSLAEVPAVDVMKVLNVFEKGVLPLYASMGSTTESPGTSSPQSTKARESRSPTGT